MRQLVCLLMSFACSTLAAAQSYRPDFDPATFKGPASGPPNEVMVVGSPHLSYLKFDPVLANAVVDRLAAWHPQAIAIEALSGVQCDFMRHYPQRYKDSTERYCWDTAPARNATGLDVLTATVQAEKLLAAWPAAPTPEQRRHLAALFLAGGEPGAALVQWLRLPATGRHAGDGLDAALVAYLQKTEVATNERSLVAARLAARLGLERLYGMDDHTADSDDDDEAVSKAYGAAMEKAWNNEANHQRKRTDDALEANLRTPDNLLAVYRRNNAAGFGKVVFDTDFGAALNEPSPQHYGRQYVGYWETRNLRMASNIRDVLGLAPGMRMLVIVGASHKPYLEAYLNQMHDVRLADVAPLLK